MDESHHNFEMDHPIALKLCNWLVDVYSNSSKALEAVVIVTGSPLFENLWSCSDRNRMSPTQKPWEL